MDYPVKLTNPIQPKILVFEGRTEGTPPKGWAIEGHGDVAARLDSLDGRRNSVGLMSDIVPMVGRQHHKRQSAPRQILLISKVLVRAYHHVEAAVFGSLNQFPICEGAPAHLQGGPDFVANESAS
jgi:hypothetical protein